MFELLTKVRGFLKLTTTFCVNGSLYRAIGHFLNPNGTSEWVIGMFFYGKMEKIRVFFIYFSKTQPIPYDLRYTLPINAQNTHQNHYFRDYGTLFRRIMGFFMGIPVRDRIYPGPDPMDLPPWLRSGEMGDQEAKEGKSQPGKMIKAPLFST